MVLSDNRKNDSCDQAFINYNFSYMILRAGKTVLRARARKHKSKRTHY